MPSSHASAGRSGAAARNPSGPPSTTNPSRRSVTITPPARRSLSSSVTAPPAAWDLQRAGVAGALLERGRRAGGVIVTERRDGFVVEGGPDGFLAAEPDLPALARELGIADRLVDQLARGAA